MPVERLQKIISAAGLCSRRAAEELITAGRVRVNGPAVTELGAKADPETDEILVDGKPLRQHTPHVYLMLNKPRGCVTTVDDPEGRPTVMDFLKHIKERIYPVGRLDFHSEGLLLFTNDGEFANRILSTGFGVNKTYWAKVHGTPSAEALDGLREGVMMDGRRTLPAEIRPLPQHGGQDWRDEGRRRKVTGRPRKPRREVLDDEGDDGNPWFEVILQEGRQNQIRRMFELIGHPVRKLRRVRIGRLTLGTLKPGELRSLTPGEVDQLMAGERERTSASPRKRRSAAEFRKTFQRGASAPGRPDEPMDEVSAEQPGGELPPEPAETTPQQSPAASQHAAARRGKPAPVAPRASTAPVLSADESQLKRQDASQQDFAPAELPRPRRPFERRPERAPEPRFDQRRPFTSKKFSRPPDQRRPFEKRPYASQPPERRESAGRGEHRPFGRGGPARPRFERTRPPRGDFQQQGTPRGGFERPGASRGGFRRDEQPREEFPRQGRERGGIERGEFRPRGPAREGFERPGRGHGGFKRGGRPRDTFPPEKYADAGRPRESGQRPFHPRPPRPFGEDRARFERTPSRYGQGGRPSRESRQGERPTRSHGRPPEGEERPRGARPFERRPFAPKPFDARSAKPRSPSKGRPAPGGAPRRPPPRGHE